MESRIRTIFLALALLIMWSVQVNAQSQSTLGNSILIQPEVQRTEFNEALIASKDVELLFSFGFIAIEDFGTQSATIFGVNYHINESLFMAFDYGLSEGGQTSYEILSGGAPILTNQEREFIFYRINLAYHLLPGESFLTDQTTYNSSFYLSAGIGNTEFAGNDRFSINYGAGYRLLLTDELSLSTDFRNTNFELDVFGEEKTTNNLEFTVRIGWYF